MAKGYSTDLRDRVVALVDAGESRREAARLLDLAASTTIRWMHVDHDNWSSFPSRHNRAQRRSCFGEMQNQ